MAIVLGSVLDGIPESFVLGRTVLQGGGEPVAARRGRALQPAGGHGVLSALSAAAGYLLLDPASGRTGALVQSTSFRPGF
jgi:zinc transporter, ZIP family